MSAISSGMIISFDYLKTIFNRFDERLSIYGVDTSFMKKYSEISNDLVVLDYELDHDLTLSTLNESSETLIKVYHQMLNSWLIIYSKSILLIIVKIYCMLHSIYTSLKFLDKRYLYWIK